MARAPAPRAHRPGTRAETLSDRHSCVTRLFVNFDENDGFFDHAPPPAAPSYVRWAADPAAAELAGASTVDTTGEYHEFLPEGSAEEETALLHKNYGLGPRVPMYVLSPWSKGGWVNSQVTDHTSVIRFIEARFGVREPNITPYRRAVCGDLTSCFNFDDPDDSEFYASLPDTTELADRARTLTETTTPETPELPVLPAQASCVRPSRALPYVLHVFEELAADGGELRLRFANQGRGAAAVFHVYDRLHLDRIPRRYTVEPGKALRGSWQAQGGAYDVWVLGPNGFHRHFTGSSKTHARCPEIWLRYDNRRGDVRVELKHRGSEPCTVLLESNAYQQHHAARSFTVGPRGEALHVWSLRSTGYWYDFTATVEGVAGYSRRFAGRVETGKDSISDPAMGGAALGEQWKLD